MGKITDVRELERTAKDFRLDSATRIQAGLESVRYWYERNDIDELVWTAGGPQFPEQVRHEALNAALNSYINRGSNWIDDAICLVSGPQALYEARINVGNKLIQYCLNNAGQSFGRDGLATMSIRVSIPDEIRVKAGEALVQHFLSSGYQRIDELKEIAWKRQYPEAVRETAGKAVADLYIQRGEDDYILEAALNMSYTEAVRMYIGMKAVEIHIRNWNEEKLNQMANDMHYPELVRLAAKNRTTNVERLLIIVGVLTANPIMGDGLTVDNAAFSRRPLPQPYHLLCRPVR